MKHISKITIILAFLLASAVCFASQSAGDVQPNDVFTISFVNAANGEIKIGGVLKHKRESFRANSPIQWKLDRDYIEARNTRTNKPYKISAKSYRKESATSLNDFIRKKYTCDKGANDNYNSIGEYLSRYPWDMIDDEVEIEIPLILDENHMIVFSSIPGNKAFYPDYDSEEQTIYITRQKLIEAGISIFDLEKLRFHVEYQVGDVSYGITDNLMLQYFSND